MRSNKENVEKRRTHPSKARLNPLIRPPAQLPSLAASLHPLFRSDLDLHSLSHNRPHHLSHWSPTAKLAPLQSTVQRPHSCFSPPPAFGKIPKSLMGLQGPALSSSSDPLSHHLLPPPSISLYMPPGVSMWLNGCHCPTPGNRGQLQRLWCKNHSNGCSVHNLHNHTQWACSINHLNLFHFTIAPDLYPSYVS